MEVVTRNAQESTTQPMQIETQAVKGMELRDWKLSISLDDADNLIVDVARPGFSLRKVFYRYGKCDATTELPSASDSCLEELLGKVGNGKRKRDEGNIEIFEHHRKRPRANQIKETTFCFSALPPELQIRIFEFLPPRDVLSNVSRVCKDWTSLLAHDSLWHTLHVVHFGRNQRMGKTWKLQCKEVMQRVQRQEQRSTRKLFFWAARYGYVELVRSALAQCPSLINRRNKWGIPALCKAAKKGHTDIVELLLAQPDANVNIETDLHTTALCMVADKGNVEMAKLLIARGADINIADNNGRTPLRRAASKGFKRTVLLLAKNGADVNAADIFGRTALFRAATKGATHMIRILLALGADATLPNAEGETPLYVAWKLGHKEAAEVIKAAADKTEAEKKRRLELQQAQMGLPPLSPLSPSASSSNSSSAFASSSAMRHAASSPSRTFGGDSLFNGLHGSSHLMNQRTARVLGPTTASLPISPSSSPPSSPPSSPVMTALPPTSANSPAPPIPHFATRPVTIPLLHNRAHPHPHPHDTTQGYALPNSFHPPFLCLNPTAAAVGGFVPTNLPGPSNNSPPRTAPIQVPLPVTKNNNNNSPPRSTSTNTNLNNNNNNTTTTTQQHVPMRPPQAGSYLASLLRLAGIQPGTTASTSSSSQSVSSSSSSSSGPRPMYTWMLTNANKK